MAESDGRDLLSELPNSLLIEILSLLEIKDVARTTILAKPWRDLWTTVPCLDFRDSFRSQVEGALAKWKGAKILKFRIAFRKVSPPASDVLDSWLLIPIQKQVEDLFINLKPNTDPEYSAPQCLYFCSSITKLSLSYCNLEIGENVSVQWNHLKSLKIEQPSYMTENAITRILSGAPLLEELMLLSVAIDEILNIRYSSLKLLKIGRDDCLSFMTVVNAKAMLNIWAPNLLSLHISGCIYATCLLDVPSLTNAILCFKKSCDDTSFRWIDDKFPPLEMFDHVFRRVRHVETLIVSDLSIRIQRTFKLARKKVRSMPRSSPNARVIIKVW